MKPFRLLLFAFSLSVLAAAGCRVAPPTAPPLKNLFVLLPNEDSTTGVIAVSNSAGSQQLTQPNTVVSVESATTAPTPPAPISQAEIDRLFGPTLSFVPAPELRFNLYFLLGETELAADSKADLPRILEAVKARHSTDVSIVGHTDTTGDPQSNFRLGLARAQQVSKMIQDLGFDAAQISAESHGANDLLVPTGPNVAESRNRRVEVIVR
jgi:outer membrane protein OmpA-like peptidoglycan-associated protein